MRQILSWATAGLMGLAAVAAGAGRGTTEYPVSRHTKARRPHKVMPPLLAQNNRKRPAQKPPPEPA